MSNDSVNWVLAYKTKIDSPHEFSEIRLDGNRVLIRRGAVKTFGECATEDCGNVETAQAKFKVAIEKQIADGFELTRQGHYDPARFDFQQLRMEIREGARKAFKACRRAHPTDEINAFAIGSDCSVMTIVPSANSKEALQRKIANTDEAYLRRGAAEDYFWNTAEWSYMDGSEYLDIAYRMILPPCQGIPFEMEFADFRAGFIETCVQALEDLDRASFFGIGAEREKTVVLFQIADSDYELDAVQRLNTATMYQRFRKWYDSWH